jgi:hypothetical protein
MTKANQDREMHHVNMKKADSKIADLDSHLEFLRIEVEESKKEIKQLTAALKEAVKLRAEDKEANLLTLEQSKEGLGGIKEAIKIISDFYRMTARRAARHDETDGAKTGLDKVYAYSRMDAGFQGAYGGKQDESVALVGMMQVVETDFKNTIDEVKEQEKKMLDTFERYNRQTKSTLARLDTTIKLDEEDKAASSSARQEQLAQLKTETNLVDSVLKQLEELKPVCVDSTMSYAERTAKRQEEMRALGTALCTLDTEGVESECAQAASA